MAISVDELTEAVLALPASTRASLAERIVESLDPLADEEFRGLWATEAIRRRDEVRDGRVQSIAEDEVAKTVRRLVKP
jgi:putative addiction module component (TIGR02574 family)